MTKALLQEQLAAMKTNDGQSVLEIANDHQTVMLVFLRHLGCSFCKEGLRDIAQKRNNIERFGTKIVFIHMAETSVDAYFAEHQLRGIPQVSDPECRFYISFGLIKGSLNQLFGLATLIRGFGDGLYQRGFQVGRELGDAFQMPGIFMISNGEIKTSYIYKYVSDRPNYVHLAECCTI